MCRILIGIDDTDNQESRGTGFLARQLAGEIEKISAGIVEGISRHQLFIHDDIPYTSKNSAACLLVRDGEAGFLHSFCRQYLLEKAASGSDVGLAIASCSSVPKEIIEFGISAKKEVLFSQHAYQLAKKFKLQLEGLTGTKEGVIGALAAVGLRRSGDDGRCIWLSGKELRELSGVYSVRELSTITGIDAVIDFHRGMIPSEDKIEMGAWVRPVIKQNRVLLIVEKTSDKNEYSWKVASPDYIKSISN